MQNDIRNLWKQQDLKTMHMSPEELRKKSKHVRAGVGIRNIVGFLASAGVLVFFAKFAIQVSDWPRRVGASLTVVVAVYLIYQLRQGNTKIAPRDLGASASVNFYREELTRQRDFHRGWRFWSRLAAFYPGFLLFCWGSSITGPASTWGFGRIAVVSIFLGAISIPLNLAKARKYQRLIDEVDATVPNSDKQA